MLSAPPRWFATSTTGSPPPRLRRRRDLLDLRSVMWRVMPSEQSTSGRPPGWAPGTVRLDRRPLPRQRVMCFAQDAGDILCRSRPCRTSSAATVWSRVIWRIAPHGSGTPGSPGRPIQARRSRAPPRPRWQHAGERWTDSWEPAQRMDCSSVSTAGSTADGLGRGRGHPSPRRASPRRPAGLRHSRSRTLTPIRR